MKIFWIQAFKVALGTLIMVYELKWKDPKNYCYANSGSLVPTQNSDGNINVDHRVTFAIFLYSLVCFINLVKHCF